MNTIKSLLFDPQIQVLDIDTFKNANTIALVNVSKKVEKSEKLAEFLLFCNYHKISFENPEFLDFLTENSLQKLMIELTPKLGITFLNLGKRYGVEELIRTLLQYLKDYGGVAVPEYMYDSISKIPRVKTPPKCYKFDTQIYAKTLDELLSSKKNPNTQDLMALDNLKYTLKLECGVIANRVILAKIASLKALEFSFTPHNVACVRVWVETVKTHQKHLKTSQKRLILSSLQGFDEADIMDDFATHKSFWKRLEKELKPTQKKYEKFAKVREFFRKLKANDYANSNNSIIEKSLKDDDIILKMARLKSPQYAIRNLTKVLKKNANLDFKRHLIKLDITLKQLLELYLHLKNPSGISKIKSKFFRHNSKPLNEKLSEKIATIIKDLIAQKFTKMQEDYAKTPREFTPCERDFDELKSIALPLQNDCFYDIPLSLGYMSRGSSVDFKRFGIRKKDFCVFVAWKRKDNQGGGLDLDLSACYFGEKGVSHINYTRLADEQNGIKHSGDYTSCREFKDGLITAEAINFTNLTKNRVQIVLNSFNGVDLNTYDVYVGFCNHHISKYEKHTFLNIEKAPWVCKITSASAGYLHLMSLDFTQKSVLLTGVQMSGRLFASSNSSQNTMVLVDEYYTRFKSVSVWDLWQDKTKAVYNPYELKHFLDYAINNARWE